MCENAFAAIIVQQKYISVLSLVKMFRPNKNNIIIPVLCVLVGDIYTSATTSSANEIIHTLTMTIVLYAFLPAFIYGAEQK